LHRGQVDSACREVQGHAAEHLKTWNHVLPDQIRDSRRRRILMCFEDDAAHAPLLRKNRSVEAVKRPDLPAGPRSIWIEMLVDVNRADERRVGQSQIDRTAHRIDSPVVRAGGGLTLSRTPASCARTSSTAGTLARVNPRESQDRKRHQRRTAQRSSFPCEVLHHILPCSLATVTYWLSARRLFRI